MHSTDPALELVMQLPTLPPRPADSNKGTFGRVLVISGSRGMSGASILSGSAALAPGPDWCGRRADGDPADCRGRQSLLHDDAASPGRTWAALRACEAELLALAQANNVVAMGPGLGQSGDHRPGVRGAQPSRGPMVLDADGLNALHPIASRACRTAGHDAAPRRVPG